MMFTGEGKDMEVPEEEALRIKYPMLPQYQPIKKDTLLPLA